MKRLGVAAVPFHLSVKSCRF